MINFHFLFVFTYLKIVWELLELIERLITIALLMTLSSYITALGMKTMGNCCLEDPRISHTNASNSNNTNLQKTSSW